MSLAADIASWDKKSNRHILATYKQHSHADEFVDNLIALLSDSDLQSGASWLLKHHLAESETTISAGQANKIWRRLVKLESWDAQLHVLQCFEYFPISKSAVARVEKFLRDCLEEDNKFVRAWAYSGFHVLACQHARLQPDAKRVLEQGMAQESAGSIKARIRRALRQGFPE